MSSSNAAVASTESNLQVLTATQKQTASTDPIPKPKQGKKAEEKEEERKSINSFKSNTTMATAATVVASAVASSSASASARSRLGGSSSSAPHPSLRCRTSSSCSGGAASAIASETTGFSYVYSRLPLRHPSPPSPPSPSSRLIIPSASASAFAPSPRAPFSYMGAAGARFFGSAFRGVQRVGFQSIKKPAPRYSTAAARAVWKQEVLWAESPVAEIERAAESLYHVALDIGDNPELVDGHTRPGQFVQMKVGNTKPAFLAIASPPALARKGRLEFLIKDPETEGSTASILCSLSKGDNVELSQVMGNGFKLEQLEPAEQYQTVLLFATGSGISPIRSLLESGFQADKRLDVRLYYGARNLQRMAYQDRFKDWEASGVQIVPVLSQPGADWTGAEGYVQASFSKNQDIKDASKTGAFLCGHKGMAQDVTEILIADGVPKDKILLNF